MPARKKPRFGKRWILAEPPGFRQIGKRHTTTPTFDQPYLPPQRLYDYAGKCSLILKYF